MGKIRRSTLLGLTLLLLSIAGCKVSCTTANISSLKFSKDEQGSVETKEFAPTDTVYAKAIVSNSGSTVTLKFSLFAEKAEGVKENTHLTQADMSLDLPSSGYGLYHVSPPSRGWPAGRYRIEVIMLYNGEQKDKKSDTFTVAGGSGGVPQSPEATPSIPPGGTTPMDDDDMNDRENSNTHDDH
ncbi:MAG TPA: hypothetical protein VF779_20880 [Pyrinomonadaceae bacterium]